MRTSGLGEVGAFSGAKGLISQTADFSPCPRLAREAHKNCTVVKQEDRIVLASNPLSVVKDHT